MGFRDSMAKICCLVPAKSGSSKAKREKRKIKPQNSFRKLNDEEIKAWAGVLHHQPPPTAGKNSSWLAQYKEDTLQAIDELPGSLRGRKDQVIPATKRSHEVRACELHMKLNLRLLKSTLGWLKREIDIHIPATVQPLVEAGLEEDYPAVHKMFLKLKEVSSMWIESSYYEDIYGQHVNPYWRRQHNRCPGCILARLASDREIVVALIAGHEARRPDPSDKNLVRGLYLNALLDHFDDAEQWRAWANQLTTFVFNELLSMDIDVEREPDVIDRNDVDILGVPYAARSNYKPAFAAEKTSKRSTQPAENKSRHSSVAPEKVRKSIVPSSEKKTRPASVIAEKTKKQPVGLPGKHVRPNRAAGEDFIKPIVNAAIQKIRPVSVAASSIYPEDNPRPPPERSLNYDRARVNGLDSSASSRTAVYNSDAERSSGKSDITCVSDFTKPLRNKASYKSLNSKASIGDLIDKYRKNVWEPVYRGADPATFEIHEEEEEEAAAEEAAEAECEHDDEDDEEEGDDEEIDELEQLQRLHKEQYAPAPLNVAYSTVNRTLYTASDAHVSKLADNLAHTRLRTPKPSDRFQVPQNNEYGFF